MDPGDYDSCMRIAGFVGGVTLALVGAVWVLQGLNSRVVPQSFMTGNRVWIVIGAVAFGGGVALARWNWNQLRDPSRDGR